MQHIFYEIGKEATMPNGDTVMTDGSIVKKNGITMKAVMTDGKVNMIKYYRPDGTEIKEGEEFITSDGVILKF